MKAFIFAKVAVFMMMFFCTLPLFAQSSPTVDAIKKRGELRVGIESGYVPFEMVSHDGEIIGFDAEIAHTVANALGVKVRFIDTPWDDIIDSLKNDKIDVIISGMTINSERKEAIDFSKPYFASGQTILVNKSKAGQIKSFRDINNPNVTITSKEDTSAYDTVKLFFKNANHLMTGSEAESLEALLSGKADVFVYDFPYNASVFAEHSDKLVHLSQPFTYEPLGIGVRKGDPVFVEFLNKVIADMRKDGRYDEYFNKFFIKTDWKKLVK